MRSLRHLADRPVERYLVINYSADELAGLLVDHLVTPADWSRFVHVAEPRQLMEADPAVSAVVWFSSIALRTTHHGRALDQAARRIPRHVFMEG